MKGPEGGRRHVLIKAADPAADETAQSGCQGVYTQHGGVDGSWRKSGEQAVQSRHREQPSQI